MFPKIRSFNSIVSHSMKSYKSGVWEPCEGPSAIAIGGHKGPLELRWKTNLTIDSGDQREDGSCHRGCFMGRGWRCGCAGQARAFLSSPRRGTPVSYNRMRLKVKAQACCLPACVTDACLSFFTLFVWKTTKLNGAWDLLTNSNGQTVDSCSVVGLHYFGKK